MTNARPHALSFAVAVAISSSIVSTQALAVSRLQIKSVDITGNGQVEFTQSEVIVQPTLGADQQPIPKSYTTTYPDQAQARASYDVPSEGFTDVLSGIEGGVSSVDQFETDENDVAQKYTKVLKVGDEGVFKFTHNLAEKKLVIEVRKGMTDRNSIEAARAQSDDIELLEPLTKLASPTQLAGVLKGAHGRAGNLGARDQYVALAIIPVKKVEVNGRTFMRHVVAGDQPPELQRLGQSLFVNDEALLAVATSAYIQVHVRGAKLQHKALKRLLSNQKPVGYVVLVEDGKQAYPAPARYPLLEVDQASGEIIVFRGQKPNPADIAFLDSQIFRWEHYRFRQYKATVKVKKDKIRSYQHIIRSRQIALLEELAAELAVQQDAKFNEDTLSTLSYYESLQQALTSATSDRADEFELTSRRIRIATSIIKPIWMQFQLIKNFSFKPALQNLLINHNFVQSIQNFISLANTVTKNFADLHDRDYPPTVPEDINGQMLEMVSTIKKLQSREAELAGAVKTLDRSITAMAIASDEAKLTIERLKQKLQGELQELRQVLMVMKNMADEPQQDNKRIPELEKQVSDDRADARKTHSAQLAAGLSIDDRDATPPPEKRARLTSQKIDETRQSVTASSITPTQASATPVATTSVAATSVAATSAATNSQPTLSLCISIQTGEDLSQKLASVESQLGLVPVDLADLEARQQAIEQHIEQLNAQARTEADKAAAMKASYKTIAVHCDIDDFDSKDADESQPVLNLDRTMLPNGELSQELADIESRYGLVPVDEADLEARQQTIERLFEQLNAQARTEADKAAAMKAGYTTIAAHFDIDDFDSNADIDVQQVHLVEKLKAMKAEAQSLRQQLYTTSKQLTEELLYTAGRTAALAEVLGADQNDNTLLLDRAAAETAVLNKLFKLKFLDTQLDYIRTGHSKVMPEVLETLSNLEKALQIRAPDDNNDVYLRRQAISENMQRLVRKAIQQSEEKALEILKTSEEILNIKVNEKDDETTRFNRIRRMLYGDDLTDQTLDKIDNTLWADENTALDGRALKLEKLLAHLHYKVGVHDPDQRTREQRTDPLRQVEELLKVNLIERDDRALRLARVINIFDSDFVREQLLDRIDQTFWKEDCKAIDERGLRLKKLDASFTYKVADPYHIKLFRELQKRWLAAIERQLNIPPLDFVTAVRKVKVFTAKLARDLVMNLDRDASLSDQKEALIARIQAFRDEVNQVYENEAVRRARNNEMARQLNIEDYNDDASINDQNSLIKAKLLQLDEEVINRVQPDVNMRLQIIENELDRHLALLGPKPRYVLDREAATARRVLEEAESELETAYVTVTATGPAGMKESVDGMKEYAAAVIANYVLDDIAFENGRRTAAFLANVQETLTPYANAAGLSESELIQAIHDTLMQAHATAVEQELTNYWIKPSAFLVQAVTWYYASYKPLLITHTARQAAEQSAINMSFLYLLDLTNRGDYLHRMLTPFQHWLERYGVDPDRTGQYAFHNGIEQVSEVGGLAMPLGKAAASVILLKTGSILFARQYNANPQMYRSISRLVPEIVKSMGSRQGVQVPLLHRVTPQKVKTLASTTAALVLGPVATVGAYAHGLISGFTYAQTFGFALASSLTFDFFMNDNKLLTQWLGGPLGRSLDKMNRWIGLGETQDEYVQRTAIASPQRFNETDEAYTNRVKASNRMHGWTRHENYLQFRERRDRTVKLFENGWETYFRENIPKWSFSHAQSIPYFYTLGVFYK
ncbi:hypothetical protein [Endozoicomonas sp. ALB032]|uniref:hypothetical protein n=1 Tax=Endozoicomonas sp. ALB032 TaxID=3403082 RepID=UPI003BB76227